MKRVRESVKEEDERRKKKERNRAHPVSDNILYCSNKPGTFFVSKFLAEKNGEGGGVALQLRRKERGLV